MNSKFNLKPIISAIAIIGNNRALGKENQLLWKIKKDLEYFKKMTMGFPVIMGRLTYESIGRPLPGRTNIIVTRNKNFLAPHCFICNSIEKALTFAKTRNDKEIFIIGGALVYTEALPFVDKLYLTIVDDSPRADVFFPDYADFKKIIFESGWKKEGKYKFKFLTLGR